MSAEPMPPSDERVRALRDARWPGTDEYVLNDENRAALDRILHENAELAERVGRYERALERIADRVPTFINPAAEMWTIADAALTPRPDTTTREG